MHHQLWLLSYVNTPTCLPSLIMVFSFRSQGHSSARLALQIPDLLGRGNTKSRTLLDCGTHDAKILRLAAMRFLCHS